MLGQQPWLIVGCDIRVQYEQCVREGRDVADLLTEVERLVNLEDAELRSRENETKALYDKLSSRPIKPDFKYSEPSDLAGILAESPSAAKAPELPAAPSGDELLEKLEGAWTGRIAGCLLGKPVEGWRRDMLLPVLKATDNYPMRGYIRADGIPAELVEKFRIWKDACFIDNVHGAAPVDDDTNYTTFALKLVTEYGRGFTSDDVLEGWLRWIPCFATCTAERVAYRNATIGLLPPKTAVMYNPYREWIGAQIRGDFFGYINPGDPATAAEMAFRDASISHVKNGIYGEMYIAAMIAAASVERDIGKIVETGLAYVPAKSRLAEDVRAVVAMHAGGMPALEIIEEIHKRWNEHSANDWCYTNSNAMIVTMALLCGGGDFGTSVCLAVQSAFDTDCNGATVGSIIGIRNGARGIDSHWHAPFEKKLHTSIDGYNLVSVEELAAMTMKNVK